jgi:hypothetical protein
MESLRSISNKIAAVKAALPRPPGKPAVVIFAKRFDPKNPPRVDEDFFEDDPDNPGKRRHPKPWDGRATENLWPYSTATELIALRARFEREFGPSTRAPNDGICLFIELVPPRTNEGAS